ncbi:hypothetical protein TVAG_316850 [Trichomonas vaginalis G3]|uniref:Uncharacterized protein n=1 Tax=Trichomonas vaginalis (strain ATCC PRA-98 / G3) TaxID=412133 RepID=A2F063_TRIV3|nr:hypothetical protein TVAGG3_0985550 [Trichomonas vaginalis G3]EAY01698.1 hypothetical protein TVAG_316850 [Trichomonas vaginalis G3]KAI5489633.1 hypothetical protein TVAGG3_0985550 [Trichomonas vaginalis G3]|eukprot:XP_001330394.1 hypothetical protein [Trichomonas vaginalis G3]
MDSPLTANLWDNNGDNQDGDNSPSILIDISQVTKDEPDVNQSPLLFNLETPPDPISIEDVTHDIIETDDKDDDETDTENDSAQSSNDPYYKPSSPLALHKVERVSLKDTRNNSDTGSAFFSSYFDINNSSNEYPWMDYHMDEIPTTDDTEILQKIDSEFTIQKLVEAIRSS